MNIKKGPLMEAYAMKFGYTVSEVTEWVNCYANLVGDWAATAFGIEATERERALSIRAYMEAETA